MGSGDGLLPAVDGSMHAQPSRSRCGSNRRDRAAGNQERKRKNCKERKKRFAEGHEKVLGGLRRGSVRPGYMRSLDPAPLGTLSD